jgi:hypothetical protein
MVLFETLALFGGLKDIFVYNRDLFMFNRQVNQSRIHQTQKMRIEQVLLFREDIRDLFDLTMGKMKQYLVVNTLTLAFCMGFFYEGRMPFDTPSWLFWLWGMSLGTAILFLIMSVWFAINAMITAQTFAVRLLTQWLRLPVPSKEDIAKAAATAAEFEKQDASKLLRVPIVSSDAPKASTSSSVPEQLSPVGKMRRSNSAGDVPRGSVQESESYPKMVNPILESAFSKDYKSFVEHFHLYRYLQEHWAGYDAYARVCMVVGSAQLVSVIGYMGVAWYITDHARWGGAVFTILLVVFGVTHARMNLLLSRKELIALTIFQVAGPLVGCAAAILHYIDSHNLYGVITAWLVPIAFLFHLFTLVFYLALGSETNGALPTKYSTVVSIDVLGLWEEGPEGDYANQSSDTEDQWNMHVLTGWQKKWLKATKREAPVSALIPQSVDLTNAERERYMRNSTTNRKEPPLVFRRNEAASANSDHNESLELPPTKYASTLPWVTFRQAGGITVLLWLLAVAVGIIIAVRGTDVPGWDSDPSVHQGAVGTSMWQPPVVVVKTHSSSLQARSAVTSSTMGFLERIHPDLPVLIRSLRSVTPDGLHIVMREEGELVRFLIDSNLNLSSYRNNPQIKNFATVTASTISNPDMIPQGQRAPWCGSGDMVTMIDPGMFRDCNNLRILWTTEDRRPTNHFSGIVGRFALSRSEHAVYRFQFHAKSLSMRVDARFPVPATLQDAVDIAKNEFILAVLSSDGFVAVWTLEHDTVMRKGVRELPLRTRFVWKSIVGAGGKSFVVLGEDRENALHESFYIHDILSIAKLDRFH